MKISFFLLTFLFILAPNQVVLSEPLEEQVMLEIKVTGNSTQIENARVTIVVQNQGYSKESRTYKDGKVIFKNVPVDKAYVLIVKKGYDTFWKNIEIRPGQKIQKFSFNLRKEKISQSESD